MKKVKKGDRSKPQLLDYVGLGYIAAIKLQLDVGLQWYNNGVFAILLETFGYSLETKLTNQAVFKAVKKKTKHKMSGEKMPMVNNSGMLWIECMGFCFSFALYYLSH